MAETNYLIVEKYHVSQRWAVRPNDPATLTPTVLVHGLREGQYTLNVIDFTVQDRQSGETLGTISLELEARSDITFQTA
jgi:hypothetical protein